MIPPRLWWRVLVRRFLRLFSAMRSLERTQALHESAMREIQIKLFEANKELAEYSNKVCALNIESRKSKEALAIMTEARPETRSAMLSKNCWIFMD